MFVFFVNTLLQNTMAEQNVPTQPPTRTDEQIVPRSQWLIIGKSNLLFNAQKIQEEPHLSDISGHLECQIDEQWFDLSADLLRKALAITTVIPAQPFELPSSGNTVIDFVNELGYPEPVEIISNIWVNHVYQPWRAILTLINQCLTGKTSGSDKLIYPVLQMLWGIVTQTNVDHAELLWEEFTQGIQTFFSHKASHKASLKDPKKKVTPLLIPYGWFSKVIIYYLASINNIHQHPDSGVHHTGDYFILGNLKQKLEKGKPSFNLLNEDDKLNQEYVPQEEGDDPDLELAKKMSLDAHQEKGEGEEKVIHDLHSHLFQERTESETEVAAPKGNKEQGEVDSSTVTSGVSIPVSTQGQAGSDPEKAHEALAGPDLKAHAEDRLIRTLGKVHVIIVSLLDKPLSYIDVEFLATAYPKVHENLKLITDKCAIEYNPKSHSSSMSSMEKSQR
ncbi:hypothetical protein Tco_1274309 [Tanacetum coccineum]